MKRNGKGKEYYNNGKIKFEGEYLNGNRLSGKGYDYFFDKLILIIEKDGKAKEYFDYGGLKFEGEYLNGNIWNGKGYKNEGEI